MPDDGYLYGVKNLCKKYNVLFIADEVQTELEELVKCSLQIMKMQNQIF